MSENTTIKYPTDNPLSFVRLSLPALSNMGALEVTGPIPPNHQPRIAGVELVRERGAAETDPPTAVRYTLIFPGSGFMRVAVKVAETKPSITPEQLAEQGGSVLAVVEGFTSGSFETEGGGVRPYFKATRITPAPNPTASAKG